MKKPLRTYTIQKSDETEIAKKDLMKPDLIVKSFIPEIDTLLGGFKAGEITFINGYSNLVLDIPSQLCVNTYRTFQNDVVYIDGGMHADPYRIARYARMMEIDQKEILNHIHISRAFTVYQLSALIHEMLEQLIVKCKPKTLIIGMLPALYLDPDVSYSEAQILLKENLAKIKELTKKHDLITIFTNHDKTLMENHRNLRDIIYKNSNEIVRMRQMEQCIHVNLVKKQIGTTIVRFARGQLRLEDFGMEL